MCSPMFLDTSARSWSSKQYLTSCVVSLGDVASADGAERQAGTALKGVALPGGRHRQT